MKALKSYSLAWNTRLRGGVQYFLLEQDYKGLCEYHLHKQNGETTTKNRFLNDYKAGIVIRDTQAPKILDKIKLTEGDYITEERNFYKIVSPKNFFSSAVLLTSNWTGYSNEPSELNHIKYHYNIGSNRKIGWIPASQVARNKQAVKLHKVYIPAAADGVGISILGKPFYGEPNSVCSQTYLVIGFDDKNPLSQIECENIISYIKTKFFRYLVGIIKKTQNGARGVYKFVPMQDFSKPWTDKELYEKYNFTNEEISLIEEIKEMP